VLATENTVIPYAVGVDIACRMKMTVLDVPARELERHQDRLTRAIEAETRFGVARISRTAVKHAVLDADWSASPVTKRTKTEPGPSLHERQRKPLRRIWVVHSPWEHSRP